MKILVVDDDLELLGLVSYALRQAGYMVVEASDGAAAVAAFEREEPSLAILDVNLPRLSGLEVCRKIRAASQIPVMMLTVRSAEEDQVQALDLGADDYLTKPFSHRELLARIRAVARRSSAAQTPDQGSMTVGDLEIDFGGHEVSMRGTTVDLTPKEYEILHCLA